MYLSGESVAIMDRSTHSLRAIDIDIGFPEHSRGLERGHRIAAQVVIVLRGHLHGDFDWGELLVFIGHNPDRGHVADVDTVQTDGSSLSQSLGIIEIRSQDDAWRK